MTMFIKFFLFIYLFNFAISATTTTNVNQNGATREHDCKYLQEDYETLYNTSLALYTECTNQNDETIDLYENEMQVTDILIGKLQECENVAGNLSSSVNYTTLIMSKRENIELEAELVTLRKQISKCQEKQNLELSIISDYKENILSLQGNITSLTSELYLIDNTLNECQRNLETQRKSEKKMIENLNVCLERSELLQERRDKYVLRLTSCRKNQKKLKAKLSE